MKELSKFQLIVLGIFVVAAFMSVLVLALFRASSSKSTIRSVTIWGTMSKADFTKSFLDIGTNKQSIAAEYSRKDSSTIYQSLLEAMASGKAPDMLLVTSEDFFKLRSKTVTIPFTTYPERTFKNNFIEGAEIFLNSSGVEAFPALVDPLVMYWNRDTLTANGYVAPPKYWDEFYTLASKMSTHDSNLNIIKSAVALGEFDNINNAKDILNALIVQSGGTITSRATTGFVSNLNLVPIDKTVRPPTLAALDFYTQFADPAKTTYSWSRGLSSSKDMFIAGDLAIYFGHASEEAEIKAKNPNLNFDVAMMPQVRGNVTPMTSGTFYVFALVNTSALSDGAAIADANILTTAESINRAATALSVAPARRDLLGVTQPLADKAVFYNAALFARTWLDPDKTQTTTIFSELISMINSGRLSDSAAVDRANTQLTNLLK